MSGPLALLAATMTSFPHMLTSIVLIVVWLAANNAPDENLRDGETEDQAIDLEVCKGTTAAVDPKIS